MMRAADITRRAQAGFTLIEMMVSLALIGMLSLIAANALQTGETVWRTTETRSADADRIDGVRRVMRSQISSLLPIQGRSGRLSQRLLMEGNSDSFAFVAPLPPHFGRSGLYRIEYRLVDDRLVFARSAYQIPQDFIRDFDTTRPETLIDGVEDLRFSYLLDEPNRRGWTTSLEDAARPPRLVRIEIKFINQPAERWVPLDIQPRITATR